MLNNQNQTLLNNTIGKMDFTKQYPCNIYRLVRNILLFVTNENIKEMNAYLQDPYTHLQDIQAIEE